MSCFYHVFYGISFEECFTKKNFKKIRVEIHNNMVQGYMDLTK